MHFTDNVKLPHHGYPHFALSLPWLFPRYQRQGQMSRTGGLSPAHYHVINSLVTIETKQTQGVLTEGS